MSKTACTYETTAPEVDAVNSGSRLQWAVTPSMASVMPCWMVMQEALSVLSRCQSISVLDALRPHS